MGTEKVHFTQVKETNLATLYGRALESRSRHPILRDEAAERLIRRIDYDFRKLKIRREDAVWLAIRAKQLDLWTEQFLGNNPGAIVLHLACGLDSRVYRIDPPADVCWYDLDYPEVIELRRRLYPEREGYHMIGSSVTDPRWLDEIPVDRPVMIVAEGLMMYLAENDVKALLRRLMDRFSSGQMAFDAFNRLGVRLGKYSPVIKATGASFGWGVDDPRELERWNPRLKWITELAPLEMPGIPKLPWKLRVLCGVMNLSPSLRRLNRLLRYQF